MQFKTTLALLGAMCSFGMAHPPQQRPYHPTSMGQPSPASGSYTNTGFGARTSSHGSGYTYVGNVGKPWGSNIIEISEADVSKYKYVAEFSGQNTETWLVVIWNKFGPTGKLDGHFGNSALSFSLAPGEHKFVAFDEDTQGGFSAAPGSALPRGKYGSYSSTWGEFDFGSKINHGWSGFDVSAIQAQLAGQQVQGMKICGNGQCSSISRGGGVNNAYTAKDAARGGIGGNLPPGPVKLEVIIDFQR
ncbi:hypothetical protein PAAG_00860 [Paracoccidioides lutzii Pb01]|uniref:Allergen Asp f 4 n=1 Tax=Paracoccidioides lutzii (strain ATCC MYA-826 / Pb01) TaxID=502779 RepID=C1GQR5_PARBA|nr:hypothetical protein PAAG_00860 [Paracoccidioides lutzii Pb01]EEH37939.1 hypothetical protein PAAG_00860 [Paracoccidioides lutzii Pb01]